MRIKKGDTLIEVALAIGIFSLVAISIVAVVTASTAGAQSSLETTTTREEIDVQAEALRFIHGSYIAGGQSNVVDNDRYKQLWESIVGKANNLAASKPDIIAEILQFNPTTCAELYDTTSGATESPIARQGAFLINVRQLGNIGTVDKDQVRKTIDQIVVRPATDSSPGATLAEPEHFYAAATYPRILYGASETTDAALLDQNDSADQTLSRAEGIYVVAVRDNESTAIVQGDGTVQKSAYYDFYIRTCWFSAGADRPSTVSTVIRLYDPNVIDSDPITITFDGNGGPTNEVSGNTEPQYTSKGNQIYLRDNGFTRSGYEFVSWSTNPGATPDSSELYEPGQKARFDSDTTLYAIWRPES